MVSIKEKQIFWNDQKSGVHELWPTPDMYALRIGGLPTEEEVKEYEMCKSEKELAAFCIRDCAKKGIKLVRMDEK